MHFDGLEEFRQAFVRLRRSGERIESDRVNQAVREHMERDVFPQTQILVPVQYGRLKATGRVEPGIRPDEWSVWYGDSATENDALVDYAAAVHEREARHAPPTIMHFVERPLKDSVQRLMERIARALEDEARG